MRRNKDFNCKQTKKCIRVGDIKPYSKCSIDEVYHLIYEEYHLIYSLKSGFTTLLNIISDRIPSIYLPENVEHSYPLLTRQN